MAETVTLGGVNYTIPDPGDQPNWATGLTPYLVAIAANVASAPAFMQPVSVTATPQTGVSGKTYLVTTSSVAITINLPAPSTNMWLIVKDATGAAATRNITLHRPGSQTIDGTASDKALARNFGTWIVCSDGTNYFVLNEFPDSGLLNADIATGAGIVYSKLALTGSLVNADVASGAAIAYSKLALTGSILNADLAGSIAYSKLVLTGSIVNADINTAAAIAVSKLAALTVSRAVATDGSGFLTAATTTATELGYLSGVTQNLSAVFPTFIAGRNRVMNAEMLFDQPNGGSAVTVNSTTTYSVDGWCGSGKGAAATFTMQQLTASPPTGFLNYLRVAVTATATPSAADTYLLQYRFPGRHTRDFLWGTANAKTVAVSFWARASVSGTYCLSLWNSASNLAYLVTYALTANTWTQVTATVAGPTTGTWATDNTLSWRFMIDLGSGSSSEGTAGSWQSAQIFRSSAAVKLISNAAATFDITGVQLEIGSAATPFEYVPYATQEYAVQEFYEKSYPIAVGAGVSNGATMIVTAAQFGASSMQGFVPFKVRKVLAPAVTVYTQTGTSGQLNWISTGGVATARSTTTPNISEIGFYARQTAATDPAGEGHWVADARI